MAPLNSLTSAFSALHTRDTYLDCLNSPDALFFKDPSVECRKAAQAQARQSQAGQPYTSQYPTGSSANSSKANGSVIAVIVVFSVLVPVLALVAGIFWRRTRRNGYGKGGAGYGAGLGRRRWVQLRPYNDDDEPPRKPPKTMGDGKGQRGMVSMDESAPSPIVPMKHHAAPPPTYNSSLAGSKAARIMGTESTTPSPRTGITTRIEGGVAPPSRSTSRLGSRAASRADSRTGMR